MSEQQNVQNVQIVQNAYTAFARGNIQTILDSLADDVEWALPGEGLIPQAGTYHKRDGVARFFQTLTQTTEFSNFEPREFIAQGDRVVALGSYRGKSKVTNRPFESQWAMAFTIHNGKITKFREYTDTATIGKAFAAGAASA